MAFKRKFKKSFKKFYPRKKSTFRKLRNGGGPYKKNQQVVPYLGRKAWNLPLPPRLITKVVTTNQWYITSGAGSLPLPFEIKLNSIVLPWNTTNALPAGQCTYATNSVVPRGAGTLLSATAYASFKVFASEIDIQTIPEPQGNDSINICLFPCETGAVALNSNTAQDRPFAKTYIQSGQSAIKHFRHKINVATLAGISENALREDVSSSMRGGVAVDPVYLYKWYIYAWDSASNALTGANGATVNFAATVTYYVEFFNYQNDNLS